jgi:hypothetical protein
MPPIRRFAALCLLGALTGCDLLGIEGAAATAGKREVEGKAIGGACRHAGRAIEDCYTLNAKADKAAVFAGWREMNDYMRENGIEPVAPVLPPPGAAASAPRPADHGEDAEDDEAPPSRAARSARR